MRRVIVDPASGCWLCDLGVDAGGYSRCAGTGQSHRVIYEHYKGPIAEGLELDHLCHDPAQCAGGVTCPHRRCVNPDHCEPATPQINTMRGHGPVRGYTKAAVIKAARTHCRRGHELSGDNVNYYTAPLRKTGGRVCRACAKIAAEKWRSINRPHHEEKPAPAV